MNKSDVFWCLSTEGIDYLIMHYSNNAFRFIEKSISKAIVDKFVSLAKKRECEECIQYILEHKSNPNYIKIALFDLLMKEYVWHMGEVCYNQKQNIVHAVRWLYAVFRLCRGHDDGFNICQNKYCEAFKKVYKELNNFSYIILTNLLEPYKLISDTEYEGMSGIYILDTHVNFEELRAPKGHHFEGERFIDIILKKDRKTTSDYYNKEYKDYTSLSRGFKGDYPNIFYNNLPDSVIGNKDIYKFK